MKILKSSSEVSKYNTGVYFNLQGDNSNPFIVKCKIPKEDFLSMKDYSKKNNVTINDMLLASYIRSLHTALKIKHIVLPCPVDFRKYLPQKKSEGISNFVSNMVCDVECEDNDTYLDTLLKVKRCMDKGKDSFSCLKVPLMLDMLFDTLPYEAFKKIILKSFSNHL